MGPYALAFWYSCVVLLMTGGNHCCLLSVRTTERQKIFEETSHAQTRNGVCIAPSEQGFDTIRSTAFIQRSAPNMTIGMYGTVEAGQGILRNITYASC